MLYYIENMTKEEDPIKRNVVIFQVREHQNFTIHKPGRYFSYIYTLEKQPAKRCRHRSRLSQIDNNRHYLCEKKRISKNQHAGKIV